MFGLGKKQNNSSTTSLDLGMRTMKSDLKSPNEEIHETLNIVGAPKKEISFDSNSLLASPVPKNLPVFDTKPEEKTSSIPESSIQGAGLKFNESFKENEFHSNETKKVEKNDFNKPIMSYSTQPSGTKMGNKPPSLQSIPQIPDAIKQEINKQYEPAKKQSSNNLNKGLLAATVIIFFLTIGSGIYYYYFILNPQEEPALSETIPDNDPGKTEPAEEVPIENTPQAPPILSDSTLVTVGDDGFQAAMNALPITTDGMFLRLASQENVNLSPSQQNSTIGIDLAELEPNLLNSWIYLTKDEQSNTKTGLIYELSDILNVSETVSNLEPNLPTKLSGMFIGTAPPAASSAVVFKDSEIRQSVRYYNFTPGDPTLSIDWTVVEFNELPYLVFANSRTTMMSILDVLNQ